MRLAWQATSVSPSVARQAGVRKKRGTMRNRAPHLPAKSLWDRPVVASGYRAGQRVSIGLLRSAAMLTIAQ